MNCAVTKLLLALLALASNPAAASPTYEAPLTDLNGMGEEPVEQHFVEGDFQRQDTHRLAVDVADAFVQGLEDSIQVEGCKMDLADPEGSMKKCLEAKALEAEKSEAKAMEAVSSEMAKTEADLIALESAFDQASATTQAPSDKEQKEEMHLVLLKTVFLNLNEEVKNKQGLSEADIGDLLTKIDKVVTDAASLPKTDSTVVPIPTTKELESAISSQDYDSKNAEFWNTIFSVSDRVAMGLLLRIRSIEPEVATKNLKKFLEGSDEDRLRILADTFNLNKRRIGHGDQIKRAGLDESGASFVAYDSHGRSFEDPATEKPIKRSGFLDGAVYSEEDFDAQLKRYGFDRQFQSLHEFEHVASERQDPPRESQDFRPGQAFQHHKQAFDASGKPIKRSGLDSFGHLGSSVDDELLSKLEAPHLIPGSHEVPVVFDQHQPDDKGLFTPSELYQEVPATAAPDLPDPHATPGHHHQQQYHRHKEHHSHKEHVEVVLEFEKTSPVDHLHHQPADQHHEFDAKHDPLTKPKVVKVDGLDNHFVVISVSTVVVVCLLLAVFVNRQKLRRYYSKKVAYRRVD